MFSSVDNDSVPDSAPPKHLQAVHHSVVIWYQSAAADCVPAIAKCPGINFFCQAAHRVAWGEAHPDSKDDELAVATALERGAKIFRRLLRD